MILISLILGIAYIYAMKRMAHYDSCEKEKEKHWWMKSIAVIFILFTCASALGEFSNLKGFVSDSILSSTLLGCFSLSGVVVYCFNFKRSDSRWWVKLLKFVWGLFFFFIVICMAGNIAREKYELMVVPGIVFTIMFIVTVVITGGKKRKLNEKYIETNK